MAGYYDPKKDYSKAIEDAKRNGASASEIKRLHTERQNKINDPHGKYGGKEPNMWGSNKTYSQAIRDNDRDTISKATSLGNGRGSSKSASNGSRNTGGNVRTSSNGRGSRRSASNGNRNTGGNVSTPSNSRGSSSSSSNGNRVTNLPGNAQPAQATPTPLAPAQLPSLNRYGYRDMDYTTAIQNATSAAERAQLMQERANKIKYQYGGVEPNMIGSNQKFSETQAGRTNNTAFDNNFAQNTFSAGVNYADEAAKHAAQGDWGAVEQDLIQRQAEIDAQGGNNRGLTNQQLLQQLQQQYGATYAQLSQRDQDRMTLISGGKLPYTAYNGVQGYLERGSGWQPDIDYLDLAQQYAKMGDLDGAYEALMRRGFKMYDTGSNGNGISQDQAYAMIDSLWRTSPTAQQTYQAEMDQNARWIAESGAKPNPKNAYKTKKVMGANNTAYWITYDGNGNPVIADHVSRKVGYENKHTSYTPDQIDYLAKYYSGQAGDYSQAYAPAHNIYVTQTGNGRLIDNYGNYASGESPVSTNVKGYTGSLYSDGANTNQDAAYLQSIQQRIDAGEQFGALGPSTGVNGTVPIVQTAPTPTPTPTPTPMPMPSTGVNGTVPIVQTTPMPGNSVISGSGSVGGGISGSGNLDLSPGTADVYTPGNMGDYLNQWYQNAQQQQQNTIDFGTNQAILELLRNKQDAEAQYQEQRNQIAIDEAKAKDNQALYAESRGDKGGIGAAQYDAIMNTAAQNRLAVNSAQTKLATDTSRQIADLRAQGEYEKADALLTLSQQYLSQLMSLEQWAAEYNLSVAQFNASLKQWQAEYDLKVADLLGSYNGQKTMSAKQFEFTQQQYQDSLKADQEKRLASAGEILLAAGIMPSASQLAAMGMTETEAQGYITAQKVAAAATKGKSGSRSTGSGGGTMTSMDYDGLFKAARDSGNPQSFIANNYKKYGFKSRTGLYNEYKTAVETPVKNSMEMQADHYRAFTQSIAAQLSGGQVNAALGNINSRWSELSAAQKQGIQDLLLKYGVQYNPGD